jgi:heme/copper-type cytochrome/quinol oxidase subunit 2
MDLISILATVILVTTIATTVVGIGAYAAFKLRDKRKPTKRAAATDEGPQEAVFLKRYVPPSNDEPS